MVRIFDTNYGTCFVLIFIFNVVEIRDFFESGGPEEFMVEPNVNHVASSEQNNSHYDGTMHQENLNNPIDGTILLATSDNALGPVHGSLVLDSGSVRTSGTVSALTTSAHNSNDNYSLVSSVSTPGAALAKLADLKLRRYYVQFKRRLAENGFQSGANDYAALYRLRTPIGDRTKLIVEAYSASGEALDALVFDIPFTHGHLKRAYFIFDLLGYCVPQLQEYLRQFPNNDSVLVADDMLSDGDLAGMAESDIYECELSYPPSPAISGAVSSGHAAAADRAAAPVVVVEEGQAAQEPPRMDAAGCCIMM